MKEMQKNKQRTERNYGIDCLRIVAMYMVVVIHILGMGGYMAQNNQ